MQSSRNFKVYFKKPYFYKFFAQPPSYAGGKYKLAHAILTQARLSFRLWFVQATCV